jgi:Protein of unknown function (DUF4038)/Putative collagen-binding domain of a collagenase
MKRLTISDNRRFLVWEDGQPFFWLGDTIWELFHRATMEEAKFYFENRRQMGFTVLQAVVLAEFDGLTVPNAYGELPLLDGDPLRPNEAYFRRIDRFIELAGQKGLMIGLVPTWGDKLELLAHGKGPIIFNPANAKHYGEWIGSRYRDTWNIIWVNGGDRQGGGANRPIWEALGNGIKSADPNHLMTFHPPGGGGGHSSSEWFHQTEWLDFNLAQSGHEQKHLPNWEMVSRDYHLEPAKPCLDGEPRYEDHPVNWKPQELGWFDDYDVRQAAYWAVFAGAFGHTYGCHPVWQLCTGGREPITFARRGWREALDLPGAGQMRCLRRLIESRPMLSRVPDQSILVEEKSGPEQRRACRGEGYLFIYLPQGGAVEVNLPQLVGPQLHAWWYDPRTGEARDLGAMPRAERMTFNAPWAGPCSDWVLVIDSLNREFSAPGTV